jgi:Kdo2-lipid IVA lauroyltransferase/acyltransferase
MLLKSFKVICRVFAHLPSPMLGGLATLLGNFFYYVAPFRKKVIEMQIRRTLGQEMTEKEIRRLIRKNYIHYGCMLLESLILLSFTRENADYLDKHFTAPQLELLKKSLSQKRGVILIGAHMGFWEAIGAYCVRYAAPVTVAVKLMKSGIIQALREEMQGHDQITLVDSRMGRQRIIALLNALRHGEFVGLFLDQYRPGEDFVKFLGQNARTNSAAVILWRKTRAPVILIHVLRERFGKYTLDLREASPPEFPDIHDERERQRAINGYFNSRLEEVIRERPEQWLWAHRRFKENPLFPY